LPTRALHHLLCRARPQTPPRLKENLCRNISSTASPNPAIAIAPR
jgi:hypothetical protein